VRLGYLVLFAIMLLSGCGNETPDNAARTEPKPSVMPGCGEVWVEGEIQPTDYAGCRNGDALVKPAFLECDGDDRLTTYRDRSVAITGDRIRAIKEKPFNGTLYTC
jgi:hypothetical protein